MTTWQEQLRANLERAANVERSPNLIRATDKEDALLVHAVLTLNEQPEAVSRVIDDVVGRVAALIKEAAPHDDAITRAVEWHLLQCGDDLMADWPKGHVDVVDRVAALLAAPPDDGSIGEPFLIEWQERKQAWSTSYPKMDGDDFGAIQRALALLSLWDLEQGREPRERERLLLMHGEWGMRFPKPFMYAGNSGPSHTDFAAYRNKAIADHRLRMETPGVIEPSVEHREDAHLRLLIGCFVEWECDRILEHAARSALAREDDEIAKSKDALKKLVAALATDRDDVDDPWGELDRSNPLRRPSGRAKMLWPAVREQLEQDAAKRTENEDKVPAPSLHPSVRRAVQSLKTGQVERRDDGAFWSQTTGGRRQIVPAQALVSITADILRREGCPVLVPLASYLVREVHAGWLENRDRFEHVVVPTGRDAIESCLGVRATEGEIEQALEMLEGIRIGNFPCVVSHSRKDEESTGGRRAKGIVVHVGDPMAPQGLDQVYQNAGQQLPKELRFYSFVLDPKAAPIVRGSYNPTRQSQRDFYTFGFGALMMAKRVEYLERGDVQITPEMMRDSTKESGIYHRGHHSLSDEILSSYIKPDTEGQLSLQSPTLIKTTGDRYKLGLMLKAQEDLLILAGQRTITAKERRKKGTKAKGSKTATPLKRRPTDFPR